MPPEQDEAVIEAPSLRASLEAGFAAAEAAPAPVPAVLPEAAQIAPTPEAPAAEAPKPGDQPRAADGKFAPKDNTPAAAAPEAKPADTKTPDSPAAAKPEAQAEPIQPPAALSAAAKSKWSTLDPALQAEWSKRERDMDAGLQKRAEQLKRFETLDQVIAPHRDRIHMAGIDEAGYVRSLITADEMLRGPNRLQALAQIAQGYNIDLRQLGQPGQPQPQPAAQQDPQIQAMASELAALKTEMAQSRGAAQATVEAQTQAQIDAFAKDNVYFENVRPHMAALLRTPALADLAGTNPLEAMKKAYEQACWADPEVRPLLLSEQTEKAQAAARAEATRRADEARQASVSITGSPIPGAAPVNSGPTLSTRESLERGFRDAGLLA